MKKDILKSSEEKKDEIIEHMNEKYGKNFLPLSIDEAGIDCSYDKFNCYVEGTNSRTDRCVVCRKYDEKTGECYYEDDYFGIQVRDDYEKLIKDIVSKYLDDYVLFANLTGSSYPEEYDKNATVQDLIDYNKYSRISIGVSCREKDEERFKEIANNIYDEISKEKYRGKFVIYFMDSEGFKDVDRSNYLHILSEESRYFYYRDSKAIF